MKTPFNKLLAAVVVACGFCNVHAAVIDLSSALGTSGTDGKAIYTAVVAQPTGTGFIDPFVQLQNRGEQQAYNTTENGVYDNGAPDNFNHELTVLQIGLVDINGPMPGGLALRFFLDINETAAENNNGDPILNLTEVQIFISTVSNQAVATPLAQGALVPLSNAYLVYQLDAGGADHTVKLDYSLNGGGSGKGDMTLDVPYELLSDAFATAGATFDTESERNAAYVYLYSRFSNADAGFEEWTFVRGDPLPPNDVPEPAIILLMAAGAFGLSRAPRRRFQPNTVGLSVTS